MSKTACNSSKRSSEVLSKSTSYDSNSEHQGHIKLFTYYLFNYEWYEKLSNYCQSVLRRKVIPLHQETPYIMKVPSKPARLDLWLYELVCELDNGLPFFIRFRMMILQTSRAERILLSKSLLSGCKLCRCFPLNLSL